MPPNVRVRACKRACKKCIRVCVCVYILIKRKKDDVTVAIGLT